MSDDLRALSDAATDGPWRARLYNGEWQVVDPDNETVATFEVDGDPDYVVALVNAHRAGQQVVTAADAEALTNERDAALAKVEATKDALRVAIKEGFRFRGERDTAVAENARLRDANNLLTFEVGTQRGLAEARRRALEQRRDEVARLRAKVAAVEAVCDEWETAGRPLDPVHAIRAAVAGDDQ